MKPIQAKIGKILFTDFLSFVLTLASIASLIFIVSIPLLLLWLPLLWWRVSLIKRTLENGTAVTGLIAERLFIRGEWIVWYVYQADGQKYRARNAVIAFKLPFQRMEQVTVVYDPEQPERAFLPILYTST